MMYSVAILAGGLATRLRPVTESIPKALVSVNDKPFIHYQLQYLKQQGITEVVLCLGYLGQMIENDIGDGSQFGLRVKYSYDGEKFLGTAGALKKALPLLDDNFFVLYGDCFLPIEYAPIQQVFQKKPTKALMCILKNENQWDQSNVISRANNLITYNKKQAIPEMCYIDYGLSIVNREIFSSLEENTFLDLADLFQQLSEHDQLLGLEVFERFYEVGSFKGIEETKYFFNKRKNDELFATTHE